MVRKTHTKRRKIVGRLTKNVSIWVATKTRQPIKNAPQINGAILRQAIQRLPVA